MFACGLDDRLRPLPLALLLQELKLQLNNSDISAFPFVDVPFDVTVFLFDAADQLVRG